MKLSKQQKETRKDWNKFAYGTFALCIKALLIITLLKHLVFYVPSDTMFWVIPATTWGLIK